MPIPQLPLPPAQSANNYFQPPHTIAWNEGDATLARTDRMILFGGGGLFGFASGINASILTYAAVSGSNDWYLFASGLALAALIATNALVFGYG